MTFFQEIEKSPDLGFPRPYETRQEKVALSPGYRHKVFSAHSTLC